MDWARSMSAEAKPSPSWFGTYVPVDADDYISNAVMTFMRIPVNGSSVTLNDIIQKNFLEEFAERKSQNDTMANFGVDLMDVVLPFHKFPLHIFEPRYRLMVITDSSTVQ